MSSPSYPSQPSQAVLRRNCARWGVPLPKLAKIMREADFAAVGGRNYTTDGDNPSILLTTNPGGGSDAYMQRDGAGNSGRPCLRLGTTLVSTANRPIFQSVYLKKNLTLMAVVTPLRQQSSGEVFLFAKEDAVGAANKEWDMGMNFAVGPTDFKFHFTTYIGATGVNIQDPTAWAIGTRYIVFGVRDGTRMRLWKNGRVVASGTCGTGDINNVYTAGVNVGCRPSNAGLNTRADIEMIACWDVALPDQLLRAMTGDPFLLWQQTPDDGFLESFGRAPAAAGGGLPPPLRHMVVR